MKIVILSILAIVVVLGILYYLFPIIQVCGESMYPTYHDGEILVGIRLFSRYKLNIGDVILYKSPTDTKRTVIKRIDACIMDINGSIHFYCLGDNRDKSYDSRDYGYISSKKVICKVINQRRNKNDV